MIGIFFTLHWDSLSVMNLLLKYTLQKISTSVHPLKLSLLQYQRMSSFKAFDPTEDNPLLQCRLSHFVPKGWFSSMDAFSRSNMTLLFVKKRNNWWIKKYIFLLKIHRVRELSEWHWEKKSSFISCGLTDH